ncbi:MAG: hypothetical protein ACJ74W_18550 [Pyrinomonadaceae bacterium]
MLRGCDIKAYVGALVLALLALPLGVAAQAQRRPGAVVLGPDSVEVAPEKRVGAATATYFAKTRQITVQAGPLILRGDVNDGLLLAPNFMVAGDHVVAPGWVDFVFTSYSAKKLYAVRRRLVLTADSKAVLAATPRLVLSKAAADGVTEILSQRMTYAQFQQLAAAEEVQLSLGPTSLPLTKEHLAALRDLRRCVELALSFKK